VAGTPGASKRTPKGEAAKDDAGVAAGRPKRLAKNRVATAAQGNPEQSRTGARNGKAAPRRARPTRRRRDDEVVEAAAKVFHERGYADASVQDVADELNILKGSLYHYIDTKEDLLYRVLNSLHAEVEQILEEVAAVEDLDPLERLALYVRRQVQFNAENLPRVSVYYNDVERLSEERRKAIYSRRKVHERYVASLIEDAQQRGEADDSLDPRILSNCIFGTVIWTYKWYHPGGKVSREQLASVCSAFVLEGVIGKRRAAAAKGAKKR
jgi:AcrR family transcriptional regulator